jgi:hypothetical protein
MKAKICLFLCLFLLPAAITLAQQISEDYVPEDVVISFKYKYPDAVISTWETSKGNFIARFKISDQDGSAEFTANGKWVVSRFAIPEKELPSPIATYFKNNYKSRDFMMASSELVKDGNGDTYYLLVAKKSGISQPKPSELYFDLTGKLTKKVEPDENKPVEEIFEDPVVNNANNNQNTNNQSQADTTTQTNDAANNKFNKKELPTPVNNYLRANYPEHQIKEANFVNDATMGEVYHIIMKKQGFRDEVTLFFDITGNLVKKIDAGDVKNQQQAQNTNQNQNNQQNNQTAENQNSKTNQPSAEELRKKAEGDPVNESKVPATAKTHFVSKYKKATNVSWFKMENRDFVVRCEMNGRKCQGIYAEEGTWKEFRNDVDPLALNTMILTYLKDQFRRYKTVKAEYVQVAPKIKFYEIHMVEKNNKTTNPPITKVFFDGNGKFTNVERPDVDDPNDNKNPEDDEFLKAVDADNQIVEKGTGVNEVINPKELPTDAMSYIRLNFKEHIIKECRYLYDDDLEANVYYVTVKKEGDKYEIELYFGLDGKLIRKIDPTEQKVREEGNDGFDMNNEGGSIQSESVDPKELPSGIKNYLKNNYPDFKVEKASFNSDEEFGNVYYLILKKSGVKSSTHLWFDLDGELVKTEKKE